MCDKKEEQSNHVSLYLCLADHNRLEIFQKLTALIYTRVPVLDMSRASFHMECSVFSVQC